MSPAPSGIAWDAVDADVAFDGVELIDVTGV
jgi:hypothetical protein